MEIIQEIVKNLAGFVLLWALVITVFQISCSYHGKKIRRELEAKQR